MCVCVCVCGGVGVGVVGASKPTLEESFDTKTDIMLASDKYSKEICVPEKWARANLLSSY